ncbi:MAG: ABC-F family ATP-binding cassette domain-containing protein [Bacteroidota bacterium]|jgi:ATP-binding cassette subfamily F protein uup
MNYLRAENLSKYYGERHLFSNITFTITKGQRVALIAKNGSGKTSLLNILTGRDSGDEGQVVIDKNIRWAYIEQEPQFYETDDVWTAIYKSENELLQCVAKYEEVIEQLEKDPNNIENQNQLQYAMEAMDLNNAWDIETKIKTILQQLNLNENLHSKIDSLSGGQKKRLAIARVLVQQPDFIIMDEPTNHLDIKMIEWLETFLTVNNTTLLLVTHDRYFLDKVCNEIIELAEGNLYVHKGNYAYFLEKKAQREEYMDKEADAARKHMRKELEWMRKQPKARTTKSKSRIEDFYETKEKASYKRDDAKVEIKMKMERLGSKILEVQQLSKKYDNLIICNDFTYIFKPGERIGIIGKNGVGKTTFLNMLLGTEKHDSGKISTGDTVKVGYYSQLGMQLKEDKRVIEVITDIAEYVEMTKGEKLTAKTLLTRFLFDPKKQHNYVSSLSGGEKRRLYLLTILMSRPNFLVLDEPTNDLDIETLNVLEEFLEDYDGCILVVTHDRYFMDTIVDSLFVFEGDGIVRPFNGNYQEYLNEQEELVLLNAKNKSDLAKGIVKQNTDTNNVQVTTKKKLTFNEQRLFEQLDIEIKILQNRKTEIESLLSSPVVATNEIANLGKELIEVNNSIDDKELKWLELSE